MTDDTVPTTTRLDIRFGNIRIGADIESGASLIGALKEIIRDIEEAGNEEVEINE